MKSKVAKFIALIMLPIAMLTNCSEQNGNINHLVGRNIDLKLLKMENGQPLTLIKTSVLHIHLDWCPSCIKDKELFNKLNLQSKVNLIGIKWVESSKDIDPLLIANNPYNFIASSTSTDFFVKLGMKTAPLTLVVGKNGQILYSHLGMLELSEIENEIIPIVNAN